MTAQLKSIRESLPEQQNNNVIDLELKAKRKQLKELEQQKTNLLNDLLEVKFQSFFQEHPWISSFGVTWFLEDGVWDLLWDFKNFSHDNFEQSKKQSYVLMLCFRNKSFLDGIEYSNFQREIWVLKDFILQNKSKKPQTISSLIRSKTNPSIAIEIATIWVEIVELKMDISHLERQKHQTFHDVLQEDIEPNQKDFTLPIVKHAPNISLVDASKFIPKLLLSKIKTLDMYYWEAKKEWNYQLPRKIILDFLSAYMWDFLRYDSPEMIQLFKSLQKNYQPDFVKEMFSLALAKNIVWNEDAVKRMLLQNIEFIDFEVLNAWIFKHDNEIALIFDMDDFMSIDLPKEKVLELFTNLDVYLAPRLWQNMWFTLDVHDVESQIQSWESLWMEVKRIGKITSMNGEYILETQYDFIEQEIWKKKQNYHHILSEEYLATVEPNNLWRILQPTISHTHLDWHQYSQKSLFPEAFIKKLLEKRK